MHYKMFNFTRNIIIPRVSAAIIITAISTNSYGTSDRVVVNINRTIEAALKSDPILSAELQEISIKQKTIKKLKSEFLPKLTLTSKISRTKVFDEFTGLSIDAELFGEVYTVNLSPVSPAYTMAMILSLEQNIYNGNASIEQFTQARYELKIARADYNLKVSNKFRMSLSAYFELRKAFTKYTQALLDLEHAELQEKITDGYFKTNRADLNEKRKYAIETLEKKLEANDSMTILLEVINNYRTVTAINSISATDISNIVFPDDIELINPQKLINDFSIVKNSESSRQELLVLHALSKKKELYAKWLPKIDLYASFTEISREDKLYDTFKHLEKNNIEAGARLTWNIFDGFKTSRSIDIEGHKITQAKLNAAQIYQSQNDRVSKHKISVKSRELKLDILKEKLLILIEDQEITKKKYLNNIVSRFELLKIQHKISKVKTNISINKMDLVYTNIISKTLGEL